MTSSSKLFTVFLLACLAQLSVTLVQKNVILGLKYTNYTNYEGALADGTCCDDPGLSAPNCATDQCDTSFLPCATYVGGERCKAYFESGTPVMFNNNSFVLGEWIGTNTTSSSLLVFPGPYSPGNIQVSIVAREESAGSKVLIANFSFVIDWLDTFYNKPPTWRQLILIDTRAELGVDVFYQCQKHYYGPTCSTRCDSRGTDKYTCLNDGTKNCTEGWQGPDCDELVPYCTSDPCENGGTCGNVHLGYTCTCLQGYTGQNCEHDLRTPTINTAAATTDTPTAATTTTTTVITKSPTSSSTTTRMPTKVTTTSRSLVTPTVSQQTGMTLRNSSGNSTGDLHTSKETSSSSNEDTTTIVATSVPVALGLLGIATSASVYFYKKMKRSPGREKVTPESPTPRDTINDDVEQKCSTPRAWENGQPLTGSVGGAWVSSPPATDTLATV